MSNVEQLEQLGMVAITFGVFYVIGWLLGRRR